MTVSQPYALTLTIVFCLEYSLKKWWEQLGGKASRIALSYITYRMVHLLLLTAAGFILFSEVELLSWISRAIFFVLVGCLEIPATVARLEIQKRYKVNFYHLNLLIPLLLAILSYFAAYPPLYNLNFRMLFLVTFLADPANYLVRWVLCKDESSLLERLALELLPIERYSFAGEIAAASTGEDLAALRAGRKIGTLERLLILFLVASGNVASIGLVITAKSIVRYPRLNEPEFAEYYLFGTLLSVVIVLASCFLVLGG